VGCTGACLAQSNVSIPRNLVLVDHPTSQTCASMISGSVSERTQSSVCKINNNYGNAIYDKFMYMECVNSSN
jgi:hypothetical protein